MASLISAESSGHVAEHQRLQDIHPLPPGGLKNKRIVMPAIDTSPVPGSKRRDTLYQDLHGYLRDGWWKTARTYEANPGSFFNAWHYLNDHPAFWQLKPWKTEGDPVPLNHMRNVEHGFAFTSGSIWMHVTRISRADGTVSNDGALNTHLQVQLEAGEWSWAVRDADHIHPGTHYHNVKLDCGASTYETAVITLAHNMWKHYGNDRRRCAPEYHERQLVKSDRRIKASGMPGKMAVTRPYGHLCRHQFKPGLAGTIEMVNFERAMDDRHRGKGEPLGGADSGSADAATK